MIQIGPIAEARRYLSRHVQVVFDTMVAMEAVASEGEESPQPGERVSGSVGFAGENVNGALYLHLSAPFAQTMAGAMLGLSPAELSGEAEVNDAVGEVANMLTGGLKSWLCDAGFPCSVSTPAIIRGASFAVETPPGVQRALLAFDCSGERVAVEMHLKIL